MLNLAQWTTQRRRGVQLHLLLTSTFLSRRIHPSTHCIRDSVGLMASLNPLDKRKSFAPAGKRTTFPGLSIPKPGHYTYSDLSLRYTVNGKEYHVGRTRIYSKCINVVSCSGRKVMRIKYEASIGRRGRRKQVTRDHICLN